MASKKLLTNEDLTPDHHSNSEDIEAAKESSTDFEAKESNDHNKNKKKKKKKRKRKAVEDDDKKKMDFKAMYPRLSASMESGVCMSPGHDDLRNLMKQNVGLLSTKNLMYLEQEWNSVSILELNLYLRRLELIQDQIKALTNAIKVNKLSEK